ncbi:hypothetical protein B0H13DRAFT_1887846 [Mycena leptocephala]|nr:hypothetical protein B0H13DRAFT_1887846 [Mycena leptocephala]
MPNPKGTICLCIPTTGQKHSAPGSDSSERRVRNKRWISCCIGGIPVVHCVYFRIITWAPLDSKYKNEDCELITPHELYAKLTDGDFIFNADHAFDVDYENEAVEAPNSWIPRYTMSMSTNSLSLTKAMVRLATRFPGLSFQVAHASPVKRPRDPNVDSACNNLSPSKKYRTA